MVLSCEEIEFYYFLWKILPWLCAQIKEKPRSTEPHNAIERKNKWKMNKTKTILGKKSKWLVLVLLMYSTWCFFAPRCYCDCHCYRVFIVNVCLIIIFANVKWVCRRIIVYDICASTNGDPHSFGCEPLESWIVPTTTTITTTATTTTAIAHFGSGCIGFEHYFMQRSYSCFFYMVRFHVENIDFIRLRSTGQNTYSHQLTHTTKHTHTHTLLMALTFTLHKIGVQF